MSASKNVLIKEKSVDTRRNLMRREGEGGHESGEGLCKSESVIRSGIPFLPRQLLGLLSFLSSNPLFCLRDSPHNPSHFLPRGESIGDRLAGGWEECGLDGWMEAWTQRERDS